jgi:glycosyltransferase involved in cell wall biosynthesis
MKLAIVHNLPAGGQKRALWEQCRLLSQRHTLDLYTLTTADETYLPLKPFVKNHYQVDYTYPPHFPDSVRSIYFDLPKAYQKLADIINNGGYDIAFVSPCFLTQAPYILRYLKIPSVYHCAEPKREFYEYIPRKSNALTYFATYPFRYPIKNIDVQNTRKATKVIAISSFTQKKIDKIYNISSQLNYLGINSDVFTVSDIPKENFVLSIGNYSLLKGHDFIIDCLALIDPAIRPNLVIVGQGGPEKEYIVQLARRKGVILVCFENIPDAKLIDLYNKAKLFVFAPLAEPFGLVVLEAASCGLPVLATNDGAMGELVDIRIGTTVKRDKAIFTASILDMMQVTESYKQREGRHIYVKHHWSWDRSITRLESIFQSVL